MRRCRLRCSFLTCTSFVSPYNITSEGIKIETTRLLSSYECPKRLHKYARGRYFERKLLQSLNICRKLPLSPCMSCTIWQPGVVGASTSLSQCQAICHLRVLIHFAIRNIVAVDHVSGCWYDDPAPTPVALFSGALHYLATPYLPEHDDGLHAITSAASFSETHSPHSAALEKTR